MIFLTPLIFASFLSTAEARIVDGSFEEGEAVSPGFSRPETKREEKKQEDVISIKEDDSDLRESPLPSGDSLKTHREGKKLEDLSDLKEKESNLLENIHTTGDSLEVDREERKLGDLTSLEEEDDSQENLLPPSESSDPAGGGLRQIDAKFINPDVSQPPPLLPWWKRWYLAVKQWIFGV
jgi:hypothetical protein